MILSSSSLPGRILRFSAYFGMVGNRPMCPSTPRLCLSSRPTAVYLESLLELGFRISCAWKLGSSMALHLQVAASFGLDTLDKSPVPPLLSIEWEWRRAVSEGGPRTFVSPFRLASDNSRIRALARHCLYVDRARLCHDVALSYVDGIRRGCIALWICCTKIHQKKHKIVLIPKTPEQTMLGPCSDDSTHIVPSKVILRYTHHYRSMLLHKPKNARLFRRPTRMHYEQVYCTLVGTHGRILILLTMRLFFKKGHDHVNIPTQRNQT